MSDNPLVSLTEDQTMAITPIGNNGVVNVNGDNGVVQPKNFAQADTFTPAAAGGGGGGGGSSLDGKSKKQLFQMLILNMFMTSLNKHAEKEHAENEKDNSEGEGVGAGGGSPGGPSMADIIGKDEQRRIAAAMKNAKS
jgi:hypothetical protein